MKFNESNALLHLADKPVIAQGNRQYVYQHPDLPDTLLKIPQSHTMDEHYNLLTDSWFDRRFRGSTVFKGFLREFQESFALMARHQQGANTLPVCEVRGVAQTDLGLALLYERIAEPDGELSPSLFDLVSSGRITRQHVDDLHHHFDILADENVVISNKNQKNLVYQSFADGSGRWVWIDSFGCKQTIPIRRWYRRLNERKLDQIRAKFVGIAERALRENTHA